MSDRLDIEHGFIDSEGMYFNKAKRRRKKNPEAQECGDNEHSGKKDRKSKKQHPVTQGDTDIEYSAKKKKKHKKEHEETQDEENIETKKHTKQKKKDHNKVYADTSVSAEDDDFVQSSKKTKNLKSTEGYVDTSVLEHEECRTEHPKAHKRKARKQHDEGSVTDPSACDHRESTTCLQDDVMFIFSKEGTQHSESLLTSVPKHRRKKKSQHNGTDDVLQLSAFSLGGDISEKSKSSDACDLENTQGFTIPSIRADDVVFPDHESNENETGNKMVRNTCESTPKPDPLQEVAYTSQSVLHHRSNKWSESHISDRGVSELYSSCSYDPDSEKSDMSVHHPEQLPRIKHRKKRRKRTGDEASDGSSANMEPVPSSKEQESSINITNHNELYGSSEGFVVGSEGFDVDALLFKHPNGRKPQEKKLRDQNALQHPELLFNEVSVGDFSSEHFLPSSGSRKHVGRKMCTHKENLPSLDLSEKFDITSEESSVAASSQESSGIAEGVGEQKREKKKHGKIGLDYLSTPTRGTYSCESEDVDLFADIISPSAKILSPKEGKRKKYPDSDGTGPIIEFIPQEGVISQLPKKQSKKHKELSSSLEESPILQKEKEKHQLYSEENEGDLDVETHAEIEESCSQDSELIMQVLSQYFCQSEDVGDVSNECSEGSKKKSPKKHRKDSESKELPAEQRSLEPQNHQSTLTNGDGDDSIISGQHRKKSQETFPRSHQRKNRRKESSAEHSVQNTGRPESLTDDGRDDNILSPHHQQSWKPPGQSKDDIVHNERPSSPVDRSFMEYVTRGEFPPIHKGATEPAPATIEAYERETGLSIRKHHFSPEEDEILKRNFRNITKFFHLRHPYLILGHQGSHSTEELQKAKKLTHKEKLLPLLGMGLPRRTLRMLYRRARALFHPMRMDCHATFTEEESDQLLALYARLGPKWHKIEKLMEKPADSIRIHFLQLEEKKYATEKGRWEPEEEIRLQKAMRKFGHTGHNGSLPSGVTWEQIAKEVQTRSPAQCYRRWVYAFRRTEKTKGHPKIWNKFDTIHLIHEMYHIENGPSNDYDWRVMKQHFPAAKTASILAQRWKSLVTTHVPNSKRMGQKECAAHLYRYFLPSLLSSSNISIERAVELSRCRRLKQQPAVDLP